MSINTLERPTHDHDPEQPHGNEKKPSKLKRRILAGVALVAVAAGAGAGAKGLIDGGENTGNGPGVTTEHKPGNEGKGEQVSKSEYFDTYSTVESLSEIDPKKVAGENPRELAESWIDAFNARCNFDERVLTDQNYLNKVQEDCDELFSYPDDAAESYGQPITWLKSFSQGKAIDLNRKYVESGNQISDEVKDYANGSVFKAEIVELTDADKAALMNQPAPYRSSDNLLDYMTDMQQREKEYGIYERKGKTMTSYTGKIRFGDAGKYVGEKLDSKQGSADNHGYYVSLGFEVDDGNWKLSYIDEPSSKVRENIQLKDGEVHVNPTGSELE